VTGGLFRVWYPLAVWAGVFTLLSFGRWPPVPKPAATTRRGGLGYGVGINLGYA